MAANIQIFLKYGYLTLYTVLSGDRVLYPAFATLPLLADAVTCPAGTAFAEAEAESSILVMVIALPEPSRPSLNRTPGTGPVKEP